MGDSVMPTARHHRVTGDPRELVSCTRARPGRCSVCCRGDPRELVSCTRARSLRQVPGGPFGLYKVLTIAATPLN